MSVDFAPIGNRSNRAPVGESTINRLRRQTVAEAAGRDARVPAMRVYLCLKNLTTEAVTVLGQFESDEQAVVFATTGEVRYGNLSVEAMPIVRARRFGFLHLNDSQVVTLLSSRKLLMLQNNTGIEVTLTEEFEKVIDIEEEQLSLLAAFSHSAGQD